MYILKVGFYIYLYIGVCGGGVFHYFGFYIKEECMMKFK